MAKDTKTRVPWYQTMQELAKRGREDIPEEFQLDTHLIWNSPAALDFNSPGADGFGVKRAALSVPGSIELLLSPGCCGRNTAALSGARDGVPFGERFAFYELDEKDIVTGAHLRKIPEAVERFVNSRKEKPSVVMLCLTCVDALLGTDMERVARKAEARVGVRVRPCYMYALTRDGIHPPMAAVRESMYSLLEKAEKDPAACNILGYFTPLDRDTEFFPFLRSIGLRRIREISTCPDYESFLQMAQANFNLVLNPEARDAARRLEKDLGIPSIELTRTYQADKIEHQYLALSSILEPEAKNIGPMLGAPKTALLQHARLFQRLYGDVHIAVGSRLDANPFDLALALTRYGLTVDEIFANPSPQDYAYIQALAKLSPQTRVYTNLSPTMTAYDAAASGITLALGKDAAYYHPGIAAVPWNQPQQPFGFAAVHRLFHEMAAALDEEEAKEGHAQ